MSWEYGPPFEPDGFDGLRGRVTLRWQWETDAIGRVFSTGAGPIFSADYAVESERESEHVTLLQWQPPPPTGGVWRPYPCKKPVEVNRFTHTVAGGNFLQSAPGNRVWAVDALPGPTCAVEGIDSNTAAAPFALEANDPTGYGIPAPAAKTLTSGTGVHALTCRLDRFARWPEGKDGMYTTFKGARALAVTLRYIKSSDPAALKKKLNFGENLGKPVPFYENTGPSSVLTNPTKPFTNQVKDGC